MGGGTSIEGFGGPGLKDVLGAGIVGRPVTGAPGTEGTGNGDSGATHALIDNARARARMSRTTVRIVG